MCSFVFVVCHVILYVCSCMCYVILLFVVCMWHVILLFVVFMCYVIRVIVCNNICININYYACVVLCVM